MNLSQFQPDKSRIIKMDDIKSNSPTPKVETVDMAQVLSLQEEFGHSGEPHTKEALAKFARINNYPETVIDYAISHMANPNESAVALAKKLSIKYAGTAKSNPNISGVNQILSSSNEQPIPINTRFSPVPPRSERGRARLRPKVHDRISGKDRAAGLDRDDDKGKIVDGVFVRDIQ